MGTGGEDGRDEKDAAVRILERREVFHQSIFRIEEVRLRFRRYDGRMSDEVVRLTLDRGDSVGVLLHDPASDQILLAEQFRYPTYAPGSGWLLEIPAGIVEPDESPEDCARRETFEETGYQPGLLQHIASVYLSPGGSSERAHLYYTRVSLSAKAGEGGGLAGEGEDIRSVLVSAAQAFAMARSGKIVDAKTLIALLWLEHRVRELVSSPSAAPRPAQ